jgi:hypothetical protein
MLVKFIHRGFSVKGFNKKEQDEMKECMTCHNKVEYQVNTCPNCGGTMFISQGADALGRVQAMLSQDQAAPAQPAQPAQPAPAAPAAPAAQAGTGKCPRCGETWDTMVCDHCGKRAWNWLAAFIGIGLVFVVIDILSIRSMMKIGIPAFILVNNLPSGLPFFVACLGGLLAGFVMTPFGIYTAFIRKPKHLAAK